MPKLICLYVLTAICFIVGLSPLSYSANFPLEIIRPKANLGISDRIYRAYPGLEYKIQVAAFGGAYPFKYSLNNHPSGMAINENTGIITWPNPQSSTNDITLIVTDSENSVATSTWRINVTTENIFFVDRNTIDGGDGSFERPWNSWADFYLGKEDNSYNNAIVYFKNGTYTYPSQYPTDTAGGSNRLWIVNHPKTFLAFPGDNQVFFDGERNGNRIHLFFMENNLYFDGINFIRGYGFNLESYGGNYLTVVNCTFDDNISSGSTSNQAGISFRNDAPNNGNEPPTTDAGFKLYPVVQNSTFKNIDTCGIKVYGTKYALFSGNIFQNIESAGISLKSTTDKTIIRRNQFIESSLEILAQYYAHNSDISYNFIKNTVLQIGSYGSSMGPGPTHIYRNTIVSDFWFRVIDSNDDGPIYIENNVIINSNPSDHIRDEVGEHYSITENRSVVYENLTGNSSSNIVDDDGYLTGESRTNYLGVMGWEANASYLNEDTGEDTEVVYVPPSPNGLHINNDVDQ